MTVTINGLQATKEQLEQALAQFNTPPYPRCFKHTVTNLIMLFDSLTSGTALTDGTSCTKDSYYADLTPHTDTSEWEEIPYDKDRGFYHKQLVYCWDEGKSHGAVLGFWNAATRQMFGSKGEWFTTSRWDNYSATLPPHMLQFKDAK